MASRNRAGFSLMEVLLATSVLMGSLIVLEELARLGRRNALDAEETATAQLLARAQLNRILCGDEPLKNVESQTVVGSPDWDFEVAVEPADVGDLSRLTVTVSRGQPGAVPAAQSAANERPRRSFSLTQWVHGASESSKTGTLPRRGGAAARPRRTLAASER
jgi:Tfp pilus assembly protein PilV